MISISKPQIDEEEIRAVARVLRRGRISHSDGTGPNTLQMERAFALFVGSKYAVTFNSGTSAITSALLALNIGRSDEVILPSFTHIGTVEAVTMTGARPIFVDIDPETYCLDTKKVKEAITTNTKVVIPVHLYGLPVDMQPVKEIADRNRIHIVEDASHALGSEYEGRRIGCIGDMTCFSFQEDGIITTGEGGIVTTDSSEYMELLKLIRCHGDGGSRQRIEGYNFKLSEVGAAIGIVQLSKLPRFLDNRRQNASLLSEILEESEKIIIPNEPLGRRHSWNYFTIRIKGANAGRRNKAIRQLRKRKIWAEIYYPKPIHTMPYYVTKYGTTSLLHSERAARQVVSLPIYPGLSEDEIVYIGKTTIETIG
jgi:perosamine synthetase